MQLTILLFASVLSTTIYGLSTTTLSRNETSSCTNDSIVLHKIEKSFGSMNTIYNIGFGICKGLEPHLNDAYFKAISDIYDDSMNGKFDSSEPISFGKQQVGAIVFIIIGVILIIGVPISGVIFCCVRYCGGCGAKRKHKPSKCALCIWLSMLTVAAAFVIASMAVYSNAVQDTVDNAEDIMQITSNLTKDVEHVLTSGADNIACEVNETIGAFFDDVSVIINRIPNNTFDKFEKNYGYDDMKKILKENSNTSQKFVAAIGAISTASKDLQDLKKLPWTARNNDSQIEIIGVLEALIAINKSLSSVNERFNAVYNQLNSTFDDVDHKILNAKNQVKNSIRSADSSLQRTKQDFDHVTTSLRTTVDQIKSQLNEQNEQIFGGYHNSSHLILTKGGVVPGLKALILIPCALIVVPALITLFCGIARLPMNDSNPSKRPVIFAVGGCIAMTGVFFGFVLSWIVSVVATLSFVGSYSAEMICEPLFYDPQMRILTNISFLQFTVPPITGNESTTINLGEVMKSCANHSSIFNALNGDSLLDVSDILNQANLQKYKNDAITEFENQNLDYTFSDNNTLLLENVTGKLESNLKNFTTVKLNYTRKAAGNHTDRMQEVYSAEEKLRDVRVKIRNIVDKMKKTLNETKTVIHRAEKSGNFTAEGRKIISKVFDETISKVTEKVYNSKQSLLNNTFDCHPLYELWENIGDAICKVIIMPIQGIWTSAGLAAVFIIVLIASLILTAKYLQRMNPAYDRQPVIRKPFQNQWSSSKKMSGRHYIYPQ